MEKVQKTIKLTVGQSKNKIDFLDASTALIEDDDNIETDFF